MSRSYRKRPFCKEKYGKDRKWAKRLAQRAVRKCQYKIPNGCTYKNLINRWDINDYTFRQPWNIYAKKRWGSWYKWARCYHLK